MKKVVIIFFGIFLISLGISTCVYANMGIDPGMTFFYGMKNLFHIPLGVTTLIFNVLFLIPMILFNTKRIGLGTLINMAFVGFFVDIINEIIFKDIVFEGSIGFHLFILILGIIVQSLGVVVYSRCNMGQAPLDGIPNVLMH